MHISHGLTFVCALALVAGCAVNEPLGPPPERRSTPPLPVPSETSVEPPVATAPIPAATPTAPAPAPTVAAGDLPCVQTSHGCISTNPDVTEATLGQTICVTGYTKTVRPATSYTNGVKKKLLREAGIDEAQIGQYELDHIIPLAVGGHPRKLSNLMLQGWDGEDGANKKDGLERKLQNMVCAAKIVLADAQYCIAEDWVACATELRVRR